MPKVSVIIPVYGVEKYIERCARSLFGQTLGDIEYLFIDDCTPDKSIEILKEVLNDFPQRLSQVIIHRMEKNSGQAKVREWGMKNASGDYVIHCDSDDWVELDMYKTMYEKAVADDADIVVCDFYIDHNNGNSDVRIGCHDESKLVFYENLLYQIDNWSLWNKLIKKDCCQGNLIYPSSNIGEDMVICAQLVNKANKIIKIDTPFYHYILNPLSITRRVSEEHIYGKFLQIKENTDLLVSILKNEGNLSGINEIILYLKYNAITSLYPIIGIEKYYKIWKNSYPELFWKVLYINKISLKERFYFLLVFCRVYPIKKGC